MMKWADRGFWKSLLFYRQSVLYYWLLSAWYRSFTWYGAANPAILHAGMLNEKKSDVYPLLPKEFLPYTSTALDGNQILQALASGLLAFPLVIKPDIGLKGIAVKVCENEKELSDYVSASSRDHFIVQEYIDLPREFSVLFYRVGSKEKGVFSFIEKKYPRVTGDGSTSLHELINKHSHAYLNKQAVLTQHKNRIPHQGEEIVLHTIGNYAQGSTFHSLQNEIDAALVEGIDTCMQKVEGIDFCRLDLKASDIEAIRTGSFKIIEVNGGKSEPLHIYDPKVGFWEACVIIHRHWKLYTRIVNHHLAKGFQLMSTAEGVRALKHIKTIVKNKNR